MASPIAYFIPIIAKGNDTCLLFWSKKKGFHIPSQEIQIQFFYPLIKAMEKFCPLHPQDLFNVSIIGFGESHEERNIEDVASFFPLSLENGHHLLSQQNPCRCGQYL